MANLTQLNPQLGALLAEFQKAYPDVRITSGYRDPSHNAAVGGARQSQHTHGNAFDFSVAGLDENKQLEIANWLKSNGAQGFGYYPGSQSMHADLGSPRHWGPDYTSKSLGATPEWFRRFAGYNGPAAEPQAAPVMTAQASSPIAAALNASSTAGSPAADGADIQPVNIAAAMGASPTAMAGLLGGPNLGSLGMQMMQAGRQPDTSVAQLWKMAMQNPDTEYRPQQTRRIGLLG